MFTITSFVLLVWCCRFFSHGAQLKSLSPIQSLSPDGLGKQTRRLTADFFRCGKPGGENLTVRFDTSKGEIDLEIVCLPPLYELSVETLSVFPEYIETLDYQLSTSATSTNSEPDSNNDEFGALLQQQTNDSALTFRRLLQSSVNPICDKNPCVQQAETSRKVCLDQAWAYFLQNPPAADVRVKIPGRLTLETLSASAPALFQEWWNKTVAVQRSGQQLIKNKNYKNAVPRAFCIINNTLFNALDISNANQSGSGNLSEYLGNKVVQGLPCSPEKFGRIRIDPPLWRTLTDATQLSLSQATDAYERDILNSVLDVLGAQFSELKVSTLLELSSYIDENLLYYDKHLGKVFRSYLKYDFVEMYDSYGQRIRGDPNLNTTEDFVLRPGDYFECATPCPCTLQEYGEQFRSCTLNPWDMVESENGTLLGSLLGTTQKGAFIKGRFLCTPFLHPSLVRDRGQKVKSDFCFKTGKVITRAEYKKKLRKATGFKPAYGVLGGAAVVFGAGCPPVGAAAAIAAGIMYGVNYAKRPRCSGYSVQYTDQRQTFLDAIVRDANIALQGNLVLTILQSSVGSYTDADGTERNLGLTGLLGLLFNQTDAVARLSQSLTDQNSIVLSLIENVNRLSQGAANVQKDALETIQSLAEALRKQQADTRASEEQVMQGLDTARQALLANSQELNATGQVASGAIALQMSMLGNYSNDLRSVLSVNRRVGEQAKRLLKTVSNILTSSDERNGFVSRLGAVLQNDARTLDLGGSGLRPFVGSNGVAPVPLSAAEKVVLVERLRVYFMSPSLDGNASSSNVSALPGYANFSARPSGLYTRLHQKTLTYLCDVHYLDSFVIDSFSVDDVELSLGPPNCKLGSVLEENECQCQLKVTHRYCEVSLSSDALAAALLEQNGSAFVFPFDQDLGSDGALCEPGTLTGMVELQEINSVPPYQAFLQDTCQGLNLDVGLNLSLAGRTGYLSGNGDGRGFDASLSLPVLNFSLSGMGARRSYLISSVQSDSRVLVNGVAAFSSDGRSLCGVTLSQILQDQAAATTRDLSISATLANLLALALRRASTSPLVKLRVYQELGRLPAGLGIDYSEVGPAIVPVDSSTGQGFPGSLDGVTVLDPNSTKGYNRSNFDTDYEYDYYNELEQLDADEDSLGVRLNASADASALTAYYVDPITGEEVLGLPPVLQNATTVKYTQRKDVYRAVWLRTGPHATFRRRLKFVRKLPRFSVRLIPKGSMTAETAAELSKSLQDLLTIRGESFANYVGEVRSVDSSSQSAKLLSQGDIDVYGYLGCVIKAGRNTSGCERIATSVKSVSVLTGEITYSDRGPASWYTFNVDYSPSPTTAAGGLADLAGAVDYVHLKFPNLDLANESSALLRDSVSGAAVGSRVGSGFGGGDAVLVPSVWNANISSDNKMQMFSYEEAMQSFGLDPTDDLPVPAAVGFRPQDAGSSLLSHLEPLVELFSSDSSGSGESRALMCSSQPVNWNSFCQLLGFFGIVEDPDVLSQVHGANARNPDQWDRLLLVSRADDETMTLTLEVPEDFLAKAVEVQDSPCTSNHFLRFPFTNEARVEFTPPSSNATVYVLVRVVAKATDACDGDTWLEIPANASVIRFPLGSCTPNSVTLFRSNSSHSNSSLLRCWSWSASALDASLQPTLESVTRVTDTRLDVARIQLLTITESLVRSRTFTNQALIDQYLTFRSLADPSGETLGNLNTTNASVLTVGNTTLAIPSLAQNNSNVTTGSPDVINAPNLLLGDNSTNTSTSNNTLEIIRRLNKTLDDIDNLIQESDKLVVNNNKIKDALDEFLKQLAALQVNDPAFTTNVSNSLDALRSFRISYNQTVHFMTASLNANISQQSIECALLYGNLDIYSGPAADAARDHLEDTIIQLTQKLSNVVRRDCDPKAWYNFGNKHGTLCSKGVNGREYRGMALSTLFFFGFTLLFVFVLWIISVAAPESSDRKSVV